MSVLFSMVALAALPDPNLILVSSRAPVSAVSASNTVTVITAEDIQRLQSPLISDVLRLQPGVSVSRNGGAGGYTAVRLRGAEGEQTTLVIDGVKIADTASPGGGADFSTLVSQGISRVEILRGAQSLAWGSQGLGGVIAIETKAAGDFPTLELRAEAGSRDHYLVGGDASITAGPAKIAVGGNWQRTDGFSAAAEADGNTERDDFESWGGYIRADIDLIDNFVLDLRGRIQKTDTALDGFPAPAYSLADTDERQSMQDLSGVVGVGYRSEGLNLRLGWQVSDVDRRSYTPSRTPQETFVSEGQLSRFDLRGDVKLASWLTLAGGVERELTRMNSFGEYDLEPLVARSVLEGGWAQALLNPMEGLDLQAGVRHDEHSRFGGSTNFGGGASYAVIDGLRLKASWSEAFKAPTLYQLFSNYGNTQLNPETATGWDVGAEWRSADGVITAFASWYQRKTQNQIDFIACWDDQSGICEDRPYGTYDNIARAFAKGVEAGVQLKPVQGLVVGAQYTLTETFNRSEGSANFGNVLARRPKHIVTLQADYRAQAGWAVGATLMQASDSFDDAANSLALDGYSLVDLRASLPITNQLEAYARVSNLFDVAYQTAAYYGQPGRQIFGGVRVKF